MLIKIILKSLKLFERSQSTITFIIEIYARVYLPPFAFCLKYRNLAGSFRNGLQRQPVIFFLIIQII